MIRSRRLAFALTVGYALLVGFVVFWPSALPASNSVDYIWRVLQGLGAPSFVSPDAVEFVTNVMLFMPLSMLGSTYWPAWGWARWFLAGLAGTVTIELTQWLFLSDRSAQIMDVISNTLGAVLGYVLVVLMRRIR